MPGRYPPDDRSVRARLSRGHDLSGPSTPRESIRCVSEPTTALPAVLLTGWPGSGKSTICNSSGADTNRAAWLTTSRSSPQTSPRPRRARLPDRSADRTAVHTGARRPAGGRGSGTGRRHPRSGNHRAPPAPDHPRAGAEARRGQRPAAGKRNRALALGADAAVDPTAGKTVQQVRSDLGESADVVFDCVSTASTLSQAIGIASKGGTVVVVGVPTGEVSIPFRSCRTIRSGSRAAPPTSPGLRRIDRPPQTWSGPIRGLHHLRGAAGLGGRRLPTVDRRAERQSPPRDRCRRDGSLVLTPALSGPKERPCSPASRSRRGNVRS
jgi:hypothetical protein